MSSALSPIMVAALGLLMAVKVEAQSPPVAVRYVPPAEVAAKAGMVVRGTVEARECVPAPIPAGSGAPVPIYTEIRFRVNEVWKGDQAKAGDTLSFRHVGGKWQEYTTVEGPIPNYAVGDSWVMALIWTDHGWWTVWGMSQGAFKVEGEKATRNFEGLSIIKDASPNLRVETFGVAELREKMAGKAPPAASAPIASTTPRETAAGSALPRSGEDSILEPARAPGATGSGAHGDPAPTGTSLLPWAAAAMAALACVVVWRAFKRGE